MLGSWAVSCATELRPMLFMDVVSSGTFGWGAVKVGHKGFGNRCRMITIETLSEIVLRRRT